MIESDICARFSTAYALSAESVNSYEKVKKKSLEHLITLQMCTFVTMQVETEYFGFCFRFFQQSWKPR